jgi:hypothetical protein
MKGCPANTPGVGNGKGLWFWCFPRRGDLRAALVTNRPRHTLRREFQGATNRNLRSAMVMMAVVPLSKAR